MPKRNEEQKAARRAAYAANKDREAAKQRKHYAENKKKECLRQARKRTEHGDERRVAERAKYAKFTRKIKAIKRKAGCADCRTKKGQLCFDHVRGKKLFTIAHACFRSWASVEAEIAKCEVRCPSCHRFRHTRAA